MSDTRDVNITLRLTADELKAIEDRAATESRDRSNLIRLAIKQYLERDAK